MASQKILVKYPTRERPTAFKNTLQGYINNSVDSENIKYLISIDDNDNSMNWLLRHNYVNTKVITGSSLSKIHAVNRDMQHSGDWDILVLASDDMICQKHGWDEILRIEMQMNYPDTDGVLFHWDGDPATQRHNNGRGLNTMCIVGRKYFERFGYIYEPTYKSLWCDNEFTDVADILNKQFRSSEVLFKHEHHSNNPNIKPDNLMRHTQSFYTIDAENYRKRKSVNFGL